MGGLAPCFLPSLRAAAPPAAALLAAAPAHAMLFGAELKGVAQEPTSHVLINALTAAAVAAGIRLLGGQRAQKQANSLKMITYSR